MPADKFNDEFLSFFNNLNPAAQYINTYKIIVSDLYTNICKERTRGQAQIVTNMGRVIERVIKARDTLHSGVISSEDFDAIKKNCEKTLNEMGDHLQNITAINFSKKNVLNKHYKSILEIGDIYINGDLTVKRQLIKVLLQHPVVLDSYIGNMLCYPVKLIFNLTDPISESSDLDGNVTYSLETPDDDILRYTNILRAEFEQTNTTQLSCENILSVIGIMQGLASIYLKSF